MLRIARLGLIGLATIGCTTAAPLATQTATQPPVPTPIVIVVTPAPVATPTLAPVPSESALPTPSPSPTPTSTPTQAPTPTPTPAPILSAQCDAQLRPLYDAEHTLDSRLDVGVVFADYTTYVGDVSVAYNNIDTSQIDTPTCGQVGVALEKAYNEYTAAQNVWNKCVRKITCSNKSITPTLQDHWSKAKTDIEGVASDFAGPHP